jgi:signal transduction histidine kinase
MSGFARPQLARLIVPPFATIGVLAAVLMWEIEHVGSILLAIAITAGGVVIGVLVARQLRRNIDEVTDYYAALLRATDEQSRQAEAANRLKDAFLATLSHELRTPLNSVLGWARLLASGKLDAPQTARAVQAIERAGWAQSRLIEDLLDLSRIVAGKLELDTRATVVQPLVQAAVDSLRPAADAKRITR